MGSACFGRNIFRNRRCDEPAQLCLDLVRLLNCDKSRAKYELGKHLDQLEMTPTTAENGERFYLSVGKWAVRGRGGSNQVRLTVPSNGSPCDESCSGSS